ncbi:MAG: DUF3040 domain-containing protein [Acidimicrobiales bacterium]
MALSRREQQILIELESQFSAADGLSDHVRARARATRFVRHLGWAAIVVGFVLMLATLTVSVFVSFAGAVIIVLGVYAVQRWSGIPPAILRLRPNARADRTDATP